MYAKLGRCISNLSIWFGHPQYCDIALFILRCLDPDRNPDQHPDHLLDRSMAVWNTTHAGQAKPGHPHFDGEMHRAAPGRPTVHYLKLES